MTQNFDYDLIVIGGGPGGYVAAIRASQLGLKTALVEKDKLGGVCLNWGCIPSKSLIHSARVFSQLALAEKMGVKADRSGFNYGEVYKKSRKAAETLSRGVQFLMKKNGIDVISGIGRIGGLHRVTVDGERELKAKNIIIATGSRPREIPGFKFDEDKILSSTGALSLKELPGKMLILGSGAVGIEFAHIFNSFGVEVTVVELLDSILPLEDEETVQVLARSFTKRKIKILTGIRALSADKSEGPVKVKLQAKDGTEREEIADKVLVAVGRTPGTEDLGLETAGIAVERGFIVTGDYYCTNVPGIYAIGDVINTPLLAHVASKEGEISAEHMAGRNPEKRIDPLSIPGAVYCEPQIGSFGLTEKAAAEKKIKYKKATFPYRGAGKAVATEESEGIVKIITDGDTGEILGAHIVGAEATELIHEILLARHGELLPQDIASMIHAHPTLSEAVMEAMRSVEGWAIHA